MARNGSGTYSKVNTFVAGNTITAAGHNDNWDDLVTELTNSVAADGQTSMTGALKLSNGTAGSPAATFASDTNTGLYRIGADNLGFALGGTKYGDWTTTGLTITGTLTASGAVTSTGAFVASSTGAVTGNFSVNTNKFAVVAASGNTTVAGTLGVTGAVTNSSTTEMTGNVTVNTNKFTVAAATGNTVVAGTLDVTGLATLSGGVAGLIAAQSDQETATSTTLAVSPGRQQFHPSAAKFWSFITVSGGTPTQQTSFNMTSITDSGAGLYDLTIATDFSTANWAGVGSGSDESTYNDVLGITSKAAGTARATTRNSVSGALADAGSLAVIGFGDQA